MPEATSLECQRGDRRLFSGVDLRPGEVYVAGENGCGKTSLLRMLRWLSPPVAGEIRWQRADRPSGRSLPARNLLPRARQRDQR